MPHWLNVTGSGGFIEGYNAIPPFYVNLPMHISVFAMYTANAKYIVNIWK